MSPPKETRRGILDAALSRFTRYGYRRTSMDDIAGEAEVSRAALYLHFRNKEEIFRTLAAEQHDAALERARQALAAAGSVEERIHRAFEEKNRDFIELVYGSPHGWELLDESSRLCGDLSADSQRRFVRLVAGVLSSDLSAKSDLGAAAAAELLVCSANGLKGTGVPFEEYRKRIGRLVRVFLAGLGSGGRLVAKEEAVRRGRRAKSAAREKMVAGR
jgi:AcrR family transcriptional regulator